jgi:hypothetical protein
VQQGNRQCTCVLGAGSSTPSPTWGAASTSCTKTTLTLTGERSAAQGDSVLCVPLLPLAAAELHLGAGHQHAPWACMATFDLLPPLVTLLMTPLLASFKCSCKEEWDLLTQREKDR